MKAILRRALRAYCRTFSIRGRHRMADRLGKLLAPSQPEILTINGIDIPLDHSIPMYRYIYYGMYEEHNVKHMQKVVRQGDIFFDVGANVGYISALMAGAVGPEGKVYAFEPANTTYKLTRQYITPKSAPNVQLQQMAVSNEDGTATFYDTPRVIERGYAVLGSVDAPADGTPHEVPVTRIDTFCRKHGVDEIRYLKLDVEGAELMALQGAEPLLKAGKIHYLLVETSINPDNAALNAGIIDILKSNGYQSFLIDPRGNEKPIDLEQLENTRMDVLWRL